MDSGLADVRLRPGHDGLERNPADIWRIALYIPLARPRPGFWRWLKLRKGCENPMTERSSEGLDARRRKLLFRAWRRGVREMDLIVGRFADAYIDKFDETALDDFERLIEVPNADLYAWVVGDEAAPAEHRHRRAAPAHRLPRARQRRRAVSGADRRMAHAIRRRSGSRPAGR